MCSYVVELRYLCYVYTHPGLEMCFYDVGTHPDAEMCLCDVLHTPGAEVWYVLLHIWKPRCVCVCVCVCFGVLAHIQELRYVSTTYSYTSGS